MFVDEFPRPSPSTLLLTTECPKEQRVVLSSAAPFQLCISSCWRSKIMFPLAHRHLCEKCRICVSNYSGAAVLCTDVWTTVKTNDANTNWQTFRVWLSTRWLCLYMAVMWRLGVKRKGYQTVWAKLNFSARRGQREPPSQRETVGDTERHSNCL